jgi:hypothetical protein
MGWLASIIGIQPAVAGGAALALLLGVWAWRVAPRLAPSLEAIPSVVADRGGKPEREAAQ